MTENLVSITTAFSDAWNRMQTILFRPFNLGKWMALGFTAWLAGLGGGGKSFWSGGSDSGSGLGSGSGSGGSGGVDWPDWDHWGRWLLEHPLWFAAGAFGCALLIALLVLVLWLSSRGKFMFLDNVVHDRAEVVRPWHRYRRLGNSLFGFQLAFAGLALGIMLAVGLLAFAIMAGFNLSLSGPVAVLGLLVAGAFVFIFAITVAYAQYFLDGFVVPLMHRYDLGVVAAWKRFGKHFRRHPWALLLSGLFLMVLGFAAMLAVIIAGVLTCCIGLLLVIIPYIGTVILLPIPVTYRGFTVALLDQMDPGYFPDNESGPEPDPATA